MQFLLTLCLASLGIALATPTSAQPSLPDTQPCAQLTVLERDMEIARSRGQMLLRKRLETQLEELNAACASASKPKTLREQIDQQQGTVARLERELSEAKEALRLLQAQQQ